MLLNATSVFLGMKHQLLRMLGQGSGVIANTTSLSGLRYTPHGAPAYDAAKAAINHLSRTAAAYYAPFGIRIHAVAPGLTLTPMAEASFNPEQQRALASEFQPMGRMMTMGELAETFLWLCSDRASGTTGLVVPVDGGWNAR